MFKKLINKFFGVQSRRRAKRSRVDSIQDLLFFTNGIGFKLIDVSTIGLAFEDNGKFLFEIGRYYQGDLELFEQDKCAVKFKVVRKAGNIYGCEIQPNAEYEQFLSDLKFRTLLNK